MISPSLLRYHMEGLSKFITILHGAGGLPDLLQYYKGEGGVSRDPKFVLRNIWTAPNRGSKKSKDGAIKLIKVNTKRSAKSEL